MIADADMKTAHRILRDGAQMLREHCAPVEIWRELDEKADRMEQGIRVFEQTPRKPDSFLKQHVNETPDD